MSGFGALAKKLSALATAPVRVAQDACAPIRAAVDSEFQNGNDPYGQPWKPLKSGASARLEETGAMRSSLEVKQTEDGVEISFSDPKFPFHQKTRPMLGDGGKIPEAWSTAVGDAFAAVVKGGG